jgi:uncharacterized caspase-like protein
MKWIAAAVAGVAHSVATFAVVQLISSPALAQEASAGSALPQNATVLQKTSVQATGGNPWTERLIPIKKGDTLSAILRDLGATPEEIRAIAVVFGASARDGNLKDGQKLRVLLSPVRGTERLQPVRVMLVGDQSVEAMVALSDMGRYVNVDPSTPRPNALPESGANNDATSARGKRDLLAMAALAKRAPALAPWPIRDKDLDHVPLDMALAYAARPPASNGLNNSFVAQPSVAASATPRPNSTKAPEYASQSAAERRIALVIGNSEYHSAAFLPNPRRDAKAVADALRQVGFQMVDLKMDLDRDAMVKALRAFRDQADKADWALIYFAGHGIEINGVNYLIPVDARLLDDRDVRAETVSYEELLGAAGGAKMLRLLILDACRDNPFKDIMRRTMASRGSNDRGLARPPEAESGTMVVYSAKAGEVAADDTNGVNSPFARAFVAELEVPGREVRRLFDYVRDDVLEATNNRQQPFTYGSMPGRRDFYFVANPPPQPPVTVLVPPTPPSISLGPASAAAPPVHYGWIIQVGVFDAEGEARERLNAVQAKIGEKLSHASPFAEAVVAGDKTLYRARFAGIEKDEAEAICQQLKRNDIACMTIKN